MIVVSHLDAHQKIVFFTEADVFINMGEMPEHATQCLALVASSIRV